MSIDLPVGKNLAGAFFQPKLVLCDPDLIESLPENVFADGCAEVIKYGMYGSSELLDKLISAPVAVQLEEVIAKCIEMKRDIVEGDEFDTGRRQILNFGHTFAHSIEKLSAYAIPHGSAVAMGMVLITRAAVKMQLCPQACLDILLKLLSACGLPIACPFDAEELAEAALSDKKRAGDTLTLAVPVGIGAAELRPVPVAALIDWAKAGLA